MSQIDLPKSYWLLELCSKHPWDFSQPKMLFISTPFIGTSCKELWPIKNGPILPFEGRKCCL